MGFFALKISDPSSVGLVNEIKAGSDNLTIQQLNQLENELVVGSKIFIQLGGDKVSWDKGLIGLAEVTKAPFDKGYDPNSSRNFKLGLKMVLVLDSVIKREEFKYYEKAYDAGGIGPNTKGEQNQAIKALTDEQACTIIRAMVDKKHSLEGKINELFDAELCNNIFGKMQCLKKYYVTYEEAKRDELKHQDLNRFEEQNKNDFIVWLKNYIQTKGPNAGQPHSQGTQDTYIAFLSNYMLDVAGADHTIFACIDTNILENLYQMEYASESNSNGNNRKSSAIKKYKDYVEEKFGITVDSVGETDTLSPQENEKRFIQWYKNQIIPEPDSNAGSHYSEKTIMIDVRHLRRIPFPNGTTSVFLTKDVGLIDKLIDNPPQIAEESDAVNSSVPRALKKYRDYLLDTGFTADVEDEEVMKNCLEIERHPRLDKSFPLNVIIYGAPGTGKTYGTAEYALKITGTQIPDGRKAVMKAYNDLIRKGQVVFTTFHQSYGYEEFIQGLRPDTTSDKMAFKTVDGVFKRIADRALNDDQNNYVIIIDEINRANISKVFGELITLVEDDKRWGEVNETCATLQSGDVFAVPNNLYIVGTMNSADKSISLIDAALRRRFSFIEQRPDADLIADQTLKSVFTKLNLHLTDALGSADLLIGHSYFMGRTAADLPAIFNGNIIPLLYEYFYDNKKSVLKALGDALEGLGIEVVDDKIGRLYVQKKAE